MPVTEFLRVLSSQYGVSVVWSDSLDRRLVSVEADKVPIDEIFAGLARRFGVSSQRVGHCWYVGEFRNEDRATLVRKTVRLSQEDISTAIAVVLGNDARQKSYKDGLIVVSDRPEALQRLSVALDEIESVRADSWVVQLYLFSCSKDTSKSIGVDTTALLDLSYTFAKQSLAASPGNGANLASSFHAVMQATATRQDVRLVGKPLFVLGDGERSSFVSGESVPIPKKTVSGQGTVTTSGFDYVQSGLSADVSLREGGHSTASVTVHVSLGEITGYVETAPIQSKNDFTTTAVVSSSGVYLLGALDQDSSTLGASGLHELLLLKNTRAEKGSQIQVWARIYRVAGPVTSRKSSVTAIPSPELSRSSAEVIDLKSADGK